MTKRKSKHNTWFFELWAEQRSLFRLVIAHFALIAIMSGILLLNRSVFRFVLSTMGPNGNSRVIEIMDQMTSLLVGIIMLSFVIRILLNSAKLGLQHDLDEIKEKDKPFFDKVSEDISNRIVSVEK